MKCCIIGTGIAGLSAAYFLSKKHNVTVFGKNIGGLAGSFKTKGDWLEKYYHHFFLSDTTFIELLNELGIHDKIIKKHTPMGFYVDGKLYPFSTPSDLLRFKPLNFFDRLRLGIMFFYFKKTSSWKKFDKISIKKWVTKYFGKNVYEKVWKPLLYSKFTDEYDNIPVSWLWGRIHPRANSRSGSKEELCYIKGSLKEFTDKLISEIRKNNGKIIHSNVKKINIKSGKVESVESDGDKYKFDKYICALPNKKFIQIAKLPDNYRKNIEKIKYQGIVCMTLFLKKSLSPYYWININDSDISFGGVIEHTNLIDRNRYGSVVVYLFNYVPETHTLYNMNDKQLFALYLDNLKRMFPNFNKNDVISYKVHRDPYASPIYNMRYSEKKPPFETPVSNLYLLNTTQLFPEDRNINNGIKYAKNLVDVITKS